MLPGVEMKKVVILETDDTLEIRVNGILVYNFHDTGYKVAKHMMKDPLQTILLADDILWFMLFQQLREEGYFNGKKE